MLEAVYVECKEEKSIVAIKPKPAFRAIFEIAETKARSGIVLFKDEIHSKAPSVGDAATENDMCLWWRRGRVELPVQKTLMSRCTTGLASNYFSHSPLLAQSKYGSLPISL